MRGSVPNNGCVRLALAVGLALLAALSTARAQSGGDEASPGAAGGLRQLADPIVLRADRIVSWDADGRGWAILDGDAAAYVGTEGDRARRAVVRYGPDPQNPDVVVAELYAERDGQTRGDRRKGNSFRKVLRTPRAVTLEPFANGRVERLKAAPTGGWEALILESAFPRPVAAAKPKAPTQVARPPDVPATSEPIQSNDPIADVTPLPTRPTPAVAERSATEVVSAVEPITTSEPARTVPKVEPAGASPPAQPLPELPDPGVVPTQFQGPGFGGGPGVETDPLPELDPLVPAQPGQMPSGGAPLDDLPPVEGFPDLVPGPEPVPSPVPSPVPTPVPVETDPLNLPNVSPILPGTQRVVDIRPRNGGEAYTIKSLPKLADGTETYIITGGVNVLINTPPSANPAVKASGPKGTTDLSADSVVVWRRSVKNPQGNQGLGDQFAQEADDFLEFYLEGHVVVRTDDRLLAGQDDSKTYQAAQAYYDAKLKRFLGLDAELSQFAPGLITPLRIKSPRIQQYTDLLPDKDGRLAPIGPSLTRADKTMTTGSRFPYPGYSFNSRTVDITEEPLDPDDPRAQKLKRGRRGTRRTKQKLIEARQNLFFVGNLPVFYWPRMVIDPDDPTPPLQNILYLYNNYFGQMILTDWNGFKLFGLTKPDPTKEFTVDTWNVDIDVLTRRGPALGTEFAYFGEQLFNNTISPHDGYLNLWGIYDRSFDVLGGGPAIVTDSPNPLAGVHPDNPFGPGRARFDRSAVPPYQRFRGRVEFKEMMQILPEDAALDEDFRLQFNAAYVSDRHFLEEYYKRLFDVGPDQETIIYGIRQEQNRAFTFDASANLQNFYTATQDFPALKYYRLGDSLLGDRLTNFFNAGANYSNVHSAIEVGNANVFAFLPTDPVSNTGRPGFTSGRFFLADELDAPLDFGFFKLTPYLQGQVVGWDNQINNNGAVGRYMGAAGGRASAIAWRKYSGDWTESELLNIHGLNHKIQFEVDARFAYSNVGLNSLGVQDQLDDNTYEFVRRYFAMSQFTNAVLPMQYDPRLLLLRRAISPITGSTDIQGSMDTVRFGINQRLQTRRGPDGRKRVVDYMVFDVQSTYFPNSSRDNFNKPFGQTMYNYEWYLGDRTSFTSTGWFEFFDITGGKPLFTSGNPQNASNPLQFSVITAGFSKNLPPRATGYIGYSIINTGPINTSALTLSSSYLLSPKWYMTFSTMYDFGNKRWLSASCSVTKIGADFLTSIGFNADPQRQAVTAGIQVTPRISPNIRLGSSSGLPQIDTRFAPTQ